MLVPIVADLYVARSETREHLLARNFQLLNRALAGETGHVSIDQLNSLNVHTLL